VRIEEAEILHDISVKNGQEGAPIICFYGQDGMIVVGIQRGAVKMEEESVNVGLIFCEEIIHTIEE
jgi:hypothetical protein